MIALLSIMALAAVQDAGETREFRAMSAFQDGGDIRTVQVSTDRDMDADGMADEGIVRFTCRSGRMASATFTPGPTTAMIPVGRRMIRASTDTAPPPPTMTARYDTKAPLVDATTARLTAMSASPAWCAPR